MVFAGWGDMGLGSLQAGVGTALDAFKEAQRQRQLQALGQQIQTGDLTGAAATALQAGDLSTGLKLYELQQKQGDTAGLDEAFSKIMTPQGAAPAAPAVNIPGKTSSLLNMGSMSYAGAAPGTTLPSGDVMAYAPAISGNEGTTGPGGYSQTGIVIPKTGDQAYGKYQVMGANIGPWTQEILGRSMTPEEFLASPEAQDAVYRGKFGQYTQKYGPVGAAKAWFAGERGMNNPNAVDPLGTTVASYADNFQRRLGQPPQGTGQPSPAMAFAPAQAAITSATGRAPDGTPIDLAAATGPRRLGQPPAPAATSPDDETPDTPAFRPLGSPPTLPISPEARDLMQRRDQLLQLMPKAMRNPAYEKLLPATINSLNQQITEAEARYKELNKAPLETAQRQWAAENIHHYKPGSDEWHQFISEGKVSDSKDKTEAQVREQRAVDAEKQGLQKGTDAYQHFVLTGNLPPAQGDQMKAFEANALQKANDKAFGAQQSVAQMEQALKLNDKALSGDFQPGMEGFLYRNLPIGVSKHLTNPEAVVATADFNNLALSANLSLGKEMFGARVTNYDEQLLQQLRASINKSPEERKAILLRLIDNRKAIATQAQNEVEQIRSGTFFKRTKPGDVPDSIIHDNNTKAPPPGFTKAPDGEYYKPDPAYPGKFLKWTP